MNGLGLSKKRAARLERKKNKIAAIFSLNKKTEDNQEENESAAKKPRLSDEEYQVLRQQLRARKLCIMKAPKCRVTGAGVNACLSQSKEKRVPIFVADIQSLLLNSIIGNESTSHPLELFKTEKWTNLTSISVLAIENVGVDEFEGHPETFQKMNEIFQDRLEVCNPIIEGIDLSLALAYIPLTVGGLYRVAQACTSLDSALKSGFIHNIEDLLPQKKEENEEKKETESADTTETIYTPCSKLDLLLNPAQLLIENVPIPGLSGNENFVATCKEYQHVTDQSPMFSLDCEWVLCEGGVYGLARVAVVDEELKCVYHTLVKPPLPVTDYMTRYSGITAKILEKIETTLEDVQRKLQEILPPDAIIVGQSVGGDLSVLKLLHPYIIDTSVIYNLSGNRMSKSKLSMLTQVFLKRTIQTSRHGHDPIEDAVAAMELVLLKLKMGKDYGDVLMDRTNSRWLPTSHRFGQKIFTALNRMFRDPNHVITPKDERTYHPECCLHQKFFTFAQWHNVSSMLITHLEYLDHYNPLIRNLDPRWLSHTQIQPDVPVEPVGPVKVVQTHSVKDAIQKAVDGIGQKRFTLVHTRLDTFSPVDRLKEMKDVDGAIARLFDAVPTNGLLIVVFPGTRKPLQNGLCMIRIREPKMDKFVFKSDEK